MDAKVTFGVRNCKIRGVLIESFDNDNGDVYFFKYQDQVMDKHCIQMQNIVRAANVKQAKKISIDISEFLNDYINPLDKSIWFKGIKLESMSHQISKTLSKRLNIDLGTIKRQNTNIDNKAKATAKQVKLNNQQALVEKTFQEERARRITELTLERNRVVQERNRVAQEWLRGEQERKRVEQERNRVEQERNRVEQERMEQERMEQEQNGME